MERFSTVHKEEQWLSTERCWSQPVQFTSMHYRTRMLLLLLHHFCKGWIRKSFYDILSMCVLDQNQINTTEIKVCDFLTAFSANGLHQCLMCNCWTFLVSLAFLFCRSWSWSKGCTTSWHARSTLSWHTM